MPTEILIRLPVSELHGMSSEYRARESAAPRPHSTQMTHFRFRAVNFA